MATVTMNTAPNITEWYPISIDNTNGQTIAIYVGTFSNSLIDIDWGDGVIELGLSTVSTHSHLLVGDSAQIKIKPQGGVQEIKEINNGTGTPYTLTGNISQFSQFFNLELLIDYTNITHNTSDIPSTLKTLAVTALEGNVINLPSVLEFFNVNSAFGILTGNLTDLPSGLQIFAINAGDLDGTISDLPNTLVQFQVLTSTGNITGNIANLPPPLLYLNITGNNSVTGNIANFPINIEQVNISGANTIFGDLQDLPTTLTFFEISGNNLISGDFSNIDNITGLVTLDIKGSNTINGVIGDITIPITNMIIEGLNTVSGNIQDTTVTSRITVKGNNTIAGSLHLVPATVNFITIEGNNAIQNSGTKDYSTIVNNFHLTINPCNVLLVPSQVDDLLNDLDGAPFDSGIVITLTGNGVSRTAASDTAVSNITGGGGVITLTP